MTEFEVTEKEVVIRIISGVLGLIAAYWGVLFAVLICIVASGNPSRLPLALAISGPAYLVMTGYWWRVFARPSRPWRGSIWVASIAVQGTWAIIAMLPARLEPIHAWWLGACVASVLAMKLETEQDDLKYTHC